MVAAAKYGEQDSGRSVSTIYFVFFIFFFMSANYFCYLLISYV